MKTLSELSNRELDKAADRVWRRYYTYLEEQNRRRNVEAYGTDQPELSDYTVDITCQASVYVKAISPHEAAGLVRRNMVLFSDNPQISPDFEEITIHDVYDDQDEAVDFTEATD